MITRMMTHEDWLVILETDHDFTTRLAFADWLEEQGRDDEARGWRRLVEGGHQPFDWTGYSFVVDSQYDQNGWVWFSANQGITYGQTCAYYRVAMEEGRREEADKAKIPQAAFRKLSGGRDSGGEKFFSRRDAELALVRVLMEEDTHEES